MFGLSDPQYSPSEVRSIVDHPTHFKEASTLRLCPFSPSEPLCDMPYFHVSRDSNLAQHSRLWRKAPTETCNPVFPTIEAISWSQWAQLQYSTVQLKYSQVYNLGICRNLGQIIPRFAVSTFIDVSDHQSYTLELFLSTVVPKSKCRIFEELYLIVVTIRYTVGFFLL